MSARTRRTARSSSTGWPQEAKDGVTLTFRDSAGRKIATFVEHRQGRPAGAQARHQGGAQPLRLGHALSRPDQDRLLRWRRRGPSRWCPIPRTRPARPSFPAATASISRSAARPSRRSFTVVKDPRLPTTPADYAAQFALHKELVASLSKLKEALNRLRRTKRQLAEVAERAGEVRARPAQPRQGDRPEALGHREGDGRSAAQVGARRAAQSGRPQRHAVRHDRHDDDRRRRADRARRRRCRARSWTRSTARSPSSKRWSKGDIAAAQ